MDETKGKPPEAVIEALAAVRESSRANMMFRHAVVEVADDLGYPFEADWLENASPEAYMDALNEMGRRRLGVLAEGST